MSHGRYKKVSCRITRQLQFLGTNLLSEKGYEQLVMEVVYDYGNLKNKRGYKLRVYLTEKDGAIADKDCAIKEVYLGRYASRFCQSGWRYARKIADKFCCEVAEKLCAEYGVKRMPVGIGRDLEVGDIIKVGNLAFLEDGERCVRADYTEKVFRLIDINYDAEKYYMAPVVGKDENELPPMFMKFSNDHYISRVVSG